MNKVCVNGRTYTAPDGCSINVINNKVYANGKLIEDCNKCKEKKIEIKIEGNCGNVEVDAADLTVNGNIEGNVEVDAGNITCRGDIRGDVSVDAGNISCHHIFGNTEVDCGIVKGNNSMNFNSGGWFNNITQKIFG